MLSLRAAAVAAVLLPAPVLASPGSPSAANLDARWRDHGLPQSDLDSLRGFLHDSVDSGRVPGGAIILLHEGEVIVREGFGWADIDAGRPFTPDLPCRLASVTKSTTATVLTLLSEQGLLSLDDRVDSYLPDYASLTLRDGTPVRAPTLRECLSHTTGLPGNNSPMADATKPTDPNTTLGEVVAEIARQGPVAPPGTRYAYSRMGFDIAARVAEIATGEEFGALAERLLFDPLGMDSTTYRPTDSARATFPTVYGRAGGRLVPAQQVGTSPLPGAYVQTGGGLTSTLDDLASLYQMHLDGGLHDGQIFAQPSTLAQMLEVQPATSGYGLGVRVLRGGQQITHRGAVGTIFWVDFDTRVVGVVLTQLPGRFDNDFRDEIHAQVNRIFAGLGTGSSRAQTLLGRMDKDGDGFLVRSELPRRIRRRFQNADADGDGRLSVGELEAVLP